jgi:hypothetical protein
MPHVCSKCGLPEGEVEFAVEKGRKGKLYKRLDCRGCRKAYLKAYYHSNKEGYFRKYREANRERMNQSSICCIRRERHRRYAKIQTLKENTPCTDCGCKYPYFVMDFDHRDATTKKDGISSLVKSTARWDRVLEEIAKCDLVCANCHRLRTYKGQHCYKTRRYHYHRMILDELKSSIPCLDCGGTFAPCQMDLDHTDSSAKSCNVSQLMNRPTELLVAELEKCHLVCANCHRVRTNTSVRPSSETQNLAQRFEEIRSRTPYPEDQRFTEFPLAHLFGAVSDSTLARKAGVSVHMVAYFRRKAGVKALRPASEGTAPRSWHSLLGTVPDSEVARVAGLTVPTIYYHRKRLGIPSYRAQREHVEAS